MLAATLLALFLLLLSLFLLSYIFPDQLGRYRRLPFVFKKGTFKATGKILGSSIAIDGELAGLAEEYDGEQDKQLKNLDERLVLLEDKVVEIVALLKPAGEDHDL